MANYLYNKKKDVSDLCHWILVHSTELQKPLESSEKVLVFHNESFLLWLSLD